MNRAYRNIKLLLKLFSRAPRMRLGPRRVLDAPSPQPPATEPLTRREAVQRGRQPASHPGVADVDHLVWTPIRAVRDGHPTQVPEPVPLHVEVLEVRGAQGHCDAEDEVGG